MALKNSKLKKAKGAAPIIGIVLFLVGVAISIAIFSSTIDIAKQKLPKEAQCQQHQSTFPIHYFEQKVDTYEQAEILVKSLVQEPLAYYGEAVAICGAGYAFNASAMKGYILCKNGKLMQTITIC